MSSDVDIKKAIRAVSMNKPYPAQAEVDEQQEIKRRGQLGYRASIEAEDILERLTAEGKDLVMLALFNGLKAKFEPEDGIPKDPLDHLWLQKEQVGLTGTPGASAELIESSIYSNQEARAAFLAQRALIRELKPE